MVELSILQWVAILGIVSALAVLGIVIWFFVALARVMK